MPAASTDISRRHLIALTAAVAAGVVLIRPSSAQAALSPAVDPLDEVRCARLVATRDFVLAHDASTHASGRGILMDRMGQNPILVDLPAGIYTADHEGNLVVVSSDQIRPAFPKELTDVRYVECGAIAAAESATAQVMADGNLAVMLREHSESPGEGGQRLMAQAIDAGQWEDRWVHPTYRQPLLPSLAGSDDPLISAGYDSNELWCSAIGVDHDMLDRFGSIDGFVLNTCLWRGVPTFITSPDPTSGFTVIRDGTSWQFEDAVFIGAAADAEDLFLLVADSFVSPSRVLVRKG